MRPTCSIPCPRLQIINDRAAPAGDRLRAMEQLESLALGKPKESRFRFVAAQPLLAAELSSMML